MTLTAAQSSNHPLSLPFSLRHIIAFAVIAHFISSSPMAAAAAPRSHTPFGDAWLFHSGENKDARFPETYDRDWKTLSSEQSPIPTRNAPTGAEIAPSPSDPFQAQWYRKHFSLPMDLEHKTISIELGKALQNSQIWINGHSLEIQVHHCAPSACPGLECDLSPHLSFGENSDNVLSIRLASANSEATTTIKRARLCIKNPIHITCEGTSLSSQGPHATTPLITLAANVANKLEQTLEIRIETQILDAQEIPICPAQSQTLMLSQANTPLVQLFRPEIPPSGKTDPSHRYTAAINLYHNDQHVDTFHKPFYINPQTPK